MNRQTVLYRTTVEKATKSQLQDGVTYHDRQNDEVIITTASTYSIRIVSLGVKTSNFVFKALEYMLNHWRVPDKYVQFVTNGDTENTSFKTSGQVPVLTNSSRQSSL